MSRLTELIEQTKRKDAQLGADLEAEIREISRRRTFGLVFERHQPEAVELPGRRVRRGDKVRVLPPRGKTTPGEDRLWRVVRIERVDGGPVAHLEETEADAPEASVAALDDLVVVAEFRDPVFPGLVETGRVERGGPEKPFHTVINAENFHALEMLTYTHRHKVDVIYIDPPYNTGARDWKYNNHYVEGDDDYRHSKWLAFMERRLQVARDILDPAGSVLIVTIDEKEVLRLGMLLEQTFPEASIQMVSVAINPANVARRGMFGRTDEYYYFVMLGSSVPQRTRLGEGWLSSKGRTFRGEARWDLLRRSGTNARRLDRPNLFYPLYVDPSIPQVVGTGPSPGLEEVPHLKHSPAGLTPVWPIRQDGSHGTWQLGQDSLMRHVEQGRVRLGGAAERGYVVYYLKGGEYSKVVRGEYVGKGRRADGSLDLAAGSQEGHLAIPGSQWRVPGHDSTQYGSRLVSNFLPSRKFPFPKSLYAVEDSLRFFIGAKADAVVLDFFSGSGTTAQAVMRLNRQDGGWRQCISITNNEVSAEEQRALRRQGLRPGDPEWERLGICDYITKPRIEAAITGRTPEGKSIKGNYKFTDEFPMAEGFEENAAFFTLTYEGPLAVSHHRAYERVAPILWLRAGAQGEVLTDLGEDGWVLSQTYGVLEDLDAASDFLRAVGEREGVLLVFVVTDDDLAFQMVCRELPTRVEPVRLYESYLNNFEINAGRGR